MFDHSIEIPINFSFQRVNQMSKHIYFYTWSVIPIYYYHEMHKKSIDKKKVFIHYEIFNLRITP